MFKIIESEYLTITETIKLNWKERLFSWPWKPWVKINIVRKPDPDIYHLPFDNIIVCHPSVARLIKEKLNEK